MMHSFEDSQKAGKEFIDTGLKSFATMSKNMQSLATETTDYSKKSWDAGNATVEKMFTASSLDKAMEIQTAYVKKAYEGFVSQATKMGELYTSMAKDAYKPFENVVTKAK